MSGRGRRRIEVFSVRDEAGSRWVQLALRGDEGSHLLTLRLETGDDADKTLQVLRAWLTDPSAARNVFNVA